MDISTGKPQKARQWSGESVRQTDRQTTGKGMQYSSGGTSSNALLFIRPESALSSSPLTGEALSAAIKRLHAIYARISQMNRRSCLPRRSPGVGGALQTKGRSSPSNPLRGDYDRFQRKYFILAFVQVGGIVLRVWFYSCEWD